MKEIKAPYSNGLEPHGRTRLSHTSSHAHSLIESGLINKPTKGVSLFLCGTSKKTFFTFKLFLHISPWKDLDQRDKSLKLDQVYDVQELMSMIYINMILQKTIELLKYFRFNSRKSFQLSLTVILCSQYSIVEEERGILKKKKFAFTLLNYGRMFNYGRK